MGIVQLPQLGEIPGFGRLHGPLFVRFSSVNLLAQVISFGLNCFLCGLKLLYLDLLGLVLNYGIPQALPHFNHSIVR